MNLDALTIQRRSIHAQLEELDYQIDMARRTFPTLVAQRGMRVGEAEEHFRRLREARRTLAWVRDHAESLRRRAIKKEEADA